jgi:hypothetical protein
MFEDDNRIIIPCSNGSRTLFVICDEYWGFPSAVIDFQQKKYFASGSSGQMRGKNSSAEVERIVRQIIIMYIYCILNKEKEFVEKKSFLYIGGAPVPSHIIWNYIGGYELLKNAGIQNKIDGVLKTNNILFEYNFDTQVYDSVDLNFRDKVANYFGLGFGKSIVVRLTDAAVNPKTCDEIYNQSIAKYKNDPLNRDLLISNIKNSSLNRYIRVALTIRVSNRSISNQTEFYTEIVKILINNFQYLEIIFDGSSDGPRSHADREFQVAVSIVENIRNCYPELGEKIKFNHLIGHNINFQIMVYRSLDSYLTYVSGGNAKFIGFARCMGVVFGPDSKPIRDSSISFQDACNLKMINEEIALDFLDQNYSFCMSHDYIGLNNEILPPIMCPGLVHPNPDIENDFYSDFHLNPDLVGKKLIDALSYNLIVYGIYSGTKI